MIYAPNSPTTPELYLANPLERDDHLQIAAARIAINGAIAHPDNQFLLVGPCALTDEPDLLLEEQADWNAYAQENGLVVAVRRHPWKPRSVLGWDAKLGKWHGLETGYEDGIGDPAEAARTAFEILHQGATTHGNISMEVAFDQHIMRYGPMLAFAQVGARTPSEYYASDADYQDFLGLLARREPTLPVGIKNDTDGSIMRAAEDVNRINDIRSGLGLSAVSRAVLIYRGGEDAKTPGAWIDGAVNAIESTGGAVILDIAHGGEQAFDPEGKYKKSEDGQLLCLEAVVMLRHAGLRYVGLAAESSNIPSPMDPPAAVEAVKMRLKGVSALAHA